MNVRQLSTLAATWLGLLAAIAGGYGTLQTYRAQVDKEIDERKLQTFRLIEKFGSKDLSEMRERILPLVTTDTFCDGAAFAKSGLTLSQMFAFVEFFDLVQTCVDARLCDGELAYEAFGPYANWHWPGMQRVIEQTRAAERAMDLKKPYGHGLQSLARKPGYVSKCGGVRQQ
jgi:hypothetical protein